MVPDSMCWSELPSLTVFTCRLEYCGNARNSCSYVIVGPLSVVPGSRPWNGLGTLAVSRLIVSWSRTSEVLR
jgi:hypothetical protein